MKRLMVCIAVNGIHDGAWVIPSSKKFNKIKLGKLLNKTAYRSFDDVKNLDLSVSICYDNLTDEEWMELKTVLKR
jgi:hypothetical protein